MIKEVEKITKNNETQYVDWETGEELFKKSEVILIKDIIKERDNLENILENSKDDVDTNMIYAIDFYNDLLKRWKNEFKKRN